MLTLLFNRDKVCATTEFIKYFCERNEGFIPGKPQCSQAFIGTILGCVNEIYENNIKFEVYCLKSIKGNNVYKILILQNKIILE